MKPTRIPSLALIFASLICAPLGAHGDGFKTRPRVEGPAPLVATPLPELKGGDEAPARTRAAPAPRTLAGPPSRSGLAIDTSGFTGGVGIDIGTGFFGGGGSFVHVAGDRRFSTVRGQRTRIRHGRRARFISGGHFSGGRFGH